MSIDRPVTVALYSASYVPLGQVPDYISVSVSWDWLNVGSGTLVVSEEDPSAQILLSAGAAPVMVVCTVAGQRWSGRVMQPQMDFDDIQGTGTITATLVDDWVWLRYMLASQSGSAAVTQTMPQFDTQTGPTATVATHYINAAAQRLGAPVLAVHPLSDQSQQTTVNARMSPLADLLTGRLTVAGTSAQATIWLPGDAQPLNTHLTSPTIVVNLVPADQKPWLRWSRSSGGIVKGTLIVNAGTAYRAVVGLNTPTADNPATRNYDEVIDTTVRTGQGTYGLPEIYVDAPDAVLGTASQARGSQDLASHGQTVSATVEVLDGAPWTFGKDYFAGDVATFDVAGVSFTERITRVTVSDDRDNGLTVVPVVGDTSASATANEVLIRAISSIAVQLRLLQTKG